MSMYRALKKREYGIKPIERWLSPTFFSSRFQHSNTVLVHRSKVLCVLHTGKHIVTAGEDMLVKVVLVSCTPYLSDLCGTLSYTSQNGADRCTVFVGYLFGANKVGFIGHRRTWYRSLFGHYQVECSPQMLHAGQYI
jgi:hypothetical protein